MPAKHQRKMIITAIAAISVMMTFAACASVDQGAARGELSSARTAYEEAQGVNAREYAALEMTTAEEQLDSANKAFENGEYVKADYLAEKAAVNAKLAETKADTAKTKNLVQQLQDSIQELRSEIEQTSR